MPSLLRCAFGWFLSLPFRHVLMLYEGNHDNTSSRAVRHCAKSGAAVGATWGRQRIWAAIHRHLSKTSRYITRNHFPSAWLPAMFIVRQDLRHANWIKIHKKKQTQWKKTIHNSQEEQSVYLVEASFWDLRVQVSVCGKTVGTVFSRIDSLSRGKLFQTSSSSKIT